MRMYVCICVYMHVYVYICMYVQFYTSAVPKPKQGTFPDQLARICPIAARQVPGLPVRFSRFTIWISRVGWRREGI